MYGANLPNALMGRPLEGVGELTKEQGVVVRGLATQLWRGGAASLEPSQRSLAEALDLLVPPTPMSEAARRAILLRL